MKILEIGLWPSSSSQIEPGRVLQLGQAWPSSSSISIPNPLLHQLLQSKSLAMLKDLLERKEQL
jgi:hypothetical protein